MKCAPGTIADSGVCFATTHWSVLADCALTDAPGAADALSALCEMYWPPVYSYIRRRGYSPADAQDLTQAFFAHFLQKKGYSGRDPAHGKFRSFLLASVRHFLSDEWDRNRAFKRGGSYQFIELDADTAEKLFDLTTAGELPADRLFDLRWAKALTTGALDQLRQEFEAKRESALFDQLKVFLTSASNIPSYEVVAARTGLPVGTIKTHVHRLRQRYRELVRGEIARTVSSPHEINQELSHLLTVLAEAA